ncbi:MAG: hypothetical protein RIR26_1046 [Pseudomonadota bacterium]
MKKQTSLLSPAISLALGMAVLLTLSNCGPKNSVDENENDGNTTKPEPRSRLTGGSGNGASVNYCRYPLDLGTTVDPRRPGLAQTVLSTPIDSKCANFRESRISLRSNQKLTFLGRIICQSGTTSNEQICTIPTQEILSAQKNALILPLIADETLRGSEIEANVEMY